MNTLPRVPRAVITALPRLFVLALVLLAAACASRNETSIPAVMPVPADAALAAWERFEDYSTARSSEDGPFRLQCSLRYTNQGEGRRVTAIIWGNGDLPLRLDVTSMGVLAGRIRQDASELLIHSPREDKAWMHRGGQQAFLAFGLPVPLTLPDVVALLQGRYLDVFGLAEGVDPVQAGNDIRYRLENGALPGTVTLTPEGLLTNWQEAPGGWNLDIAYSGTPPLPETLEIDHPEGRHAVLTVTERESVEPFSDSQLALILPPGTDLANLRQASR